MRQSVWYFIIACFMRLNRFGPGRWAVCAADDQLRDYCVEILIDGSQTLSKRRRMFEERGVVQLARCRHADNFSRVIRDKDTKSRCLPLTLSAFCSLQKQDIQIHIHHYTIVLTRPTLLPVQNQPLSEASKRPRHTVNMKSVIVTTVFLLAGFSAAIPTNPTPPPPPDDHRTPCEPGKEWECCKLRGDCNVPPHVRSCHTLYALLDNRFERSSTGMLTFKGSSSQRYGQRMDLEEAR